MILLAKDHRIFSEHMLGVMKWQLGKVMKEAFKQENSRHIRLLYVRQGV